MTSEVENRVEYCLSLANQDSKREGRWSTAPELIPYLETEYGYTVINPLSVSILLEKLHKQERVEKKGTDLWRIMRGGSGLGGDATKSRDYQPPDQRGDDQYPDKYPTGGGASGGVGVVPMPDLRQLL